MKTTGTTLALLALSFACISANARQVRVETLVAQIDASGGMALGPDGKLYVADTFTERYQFGVAVGTKIYRVSMDGSVEEFANDLYGPVGLAFDPAGDLFVTQTAGTDNKANSVFRITPDGVQHEYALGIVSPNGVAVRSDGSLLVADCRPPGSQITRVTPTRIPTQFSASSLLSCSLGVAFDNEENLYVANLGDGAIIKIDNEGTASLFADIGQTAGFLTFANEHLYVTGVTDPRIFQVSMDGTVTVLAGTGLKGADDGPASDATFGWPWAIAASVTGDTLYVGDNTLGTQSGPAHPNLIRMITGVKSALVTANEAQSELPTSIKLAQNYPNPFNPSTLIEFDIKNTEYVRLTVLDLLGREVAVLVDGIVPSGAHSVRFDASDLSSGMYVYRISSANESVAKVMHVVR